MTNREEQTFTNMPMIMIDEPGDSGPVILNAQVGILGEGAGEQILGEGGEAITGE